MDIAEALARQDRVTAIRAPWVDEMATLAYREREAAALVPLHADRIRFERLVDWFLRLEANWTLQ